MDAVAVVEFQGRDVCAPGPEDDRCTDGLSTTDVGRQFGVDPHVILPPDGKLVILVGNGFEFVYADGSGDFLIRRERL